MFRVMMAVAAVGCAAADDPPAAPEFAGIADWVNAKPLAVKDQRGKVMVVHFWTHSCVNCVHNYPHYRGWQERYAKENDLLMVGVHTPEFDSDKDVAAIKAAAEKAKLRFPIAVDNGGKTWAAWGNRYWPCVYLVDKAGKVRHKWEGELGDAGEKKMRAAIDALLAER